MLFTDARPAQAQCGELEHTDIITCYDASDSKEDFKDLIDGYFVNGDPGCEDMYDEVMDMLDGG